jgi:succinate-semialdehyde dehydrogenase / glutarate-semialdehyde dehydrogenase
LLIYLSLGSTEVGRVLLKEAADRVIRCSMELGGNAPFLVLADANVDDAVSGALLAKMRNGGAACTAANRFYVAKEIANEFTEKLTKAMGGLKMAAGTSSGAQLGASVSVKERNKIAELVDSSVLQVVQLKLVENHQQVLVLFILQLFYLLKTIIQYWRRRYLGQ